MRIANQPRTRQITVCSSTQVTKTTLLLCFANYATFKDGNNSVFAMPTKQQSKALKRERVEAIIKASPELAKYLGKSPAEMRGAFADNKIHLNDVTQNFVGANSSSDLASVPAKWFFGDELDEWPQRADTVSPLRLGKERLKSFHDSKFFTTSTPKDHSPYIWDLLHKGTLRRYHVACPICGHYQVLHFGNGLLGSPGLKWEKDATVEELIEHPLTTYECGHCHEQIAERHKRSMVMAGVWVPQVCGIDKEGNITGEMPSQYHESFHIWAAYTLLPGVTWGHIAAEYIESKDSEDGRRNFTNSWKGEPFTDASGHLSLEEVRACKADYMRPKEEAYSTSSIRAPKGMKVLAMGIDCQRTRGYDYHYWAIRAWGPGGISALIRYGMTEAGPESWDELQRIIHEDEYLDYEGNPIPMLRPIIDAGDGNAQNQIARWAKYNNCQPYKGRGHKGTKIYAYSDVDMDEFEKFRLLTCFPPFYYDQIHRAIREGRWRLPSDTTDEYVAHQVVHQPVRVINKSNLTDEIIWKKKGASLPDHYFDAESMGFIAAYLKGLTRIRAKKKPSAIAKGEQVGPSPSTTDQRKKAPSLKGKGGAQYKDLFE